MIIITVNRKLIGIGIYVQDKETQANADRGGAGWVSWVLNDVLDILYKTTLIDSTLR